MLETLACGVTAIVSNSVGTSELMKAEGVPETLESWNATTWARCTPDVLGDPARRQAMRGAGFGLAAHYSRDRRLDVLQQLLEELRPVERRSGLRPSPWPRCSAPLAMIDCICKAITSSNAGISLLHAPSVNTGRRQHGYIGKTGAPRSAVRSAGILYTHGVPSLRPSAAHEDQSTQL